MCFCGYDPLMGESVRVFAEGLIKSLEAKANRLGLSMPEQMASEALELSTLIEQLNREITKAVPSRQRELEGLLGIVYLVRFLMRPEESASRARADFEVSAREQAGRLDASMIRFEQSFESDQDDNLSERLQRAIAAAI